MVNITTILIGIIVLFGVLLSFRSLFSTKICALCGAVSISWIILLSLFYLGYQMDPVLVGILMGGSIVGTMYLLEQKLPEKYQIFKLPFFLTLFSVMYFILDKKIIKNAVLIIFLIWLFMFIIYIGRDIKKFKMLGEKIIKCCKDW